MDRNGGKDRQALGRIVAILLALADLADDAGARPRPIRVVVLWFLRAAEGIALDFVIAMARETGVEPDLAVLPHAHDIADDAKRLARSFAALAGLLAELADRSPSPAQPGRVSGLIDDLMRTLQTLARAPAMPEPPLPDTS